MTSGPVTVTHKPPPGVAVYAETDGHRIVLMGAGPSEALAQVALRAKLLTPLVQPQGGALVLPLSWPAVVQLAASYGDAWQPGPALQSWMAAQVARRQPAGDSRPQGLGFALPGGYVPYSWQLEGAAMIRDVGSVLICDDPGTGKTDTALLGLRARSAAGHPVWPALAIVPPSTIDAWVTRARFHGLIAVPWRGTRLRRGRLLDLAAHLYVVGYPLVWRDAPAAGSAGAEQHRPLIQLRARSLVIDECHKIKDPHSKQSAAVRRLADRADIAVGLSGTPITHDPGDLWPTLHCMTPAAWPSSERYRDRYLSTVPGDYGEEVLGLAPHAEREFRMCLLGQMRRVAKADALELPPKVYSVRTVELPLKWRALYDQMEEEMLAEVPDDIDPIMAQTIVVKMTRLAQLASAAAVDVQTEWKPDKTTGELKRTQKITLGAPSWKADALLEVLEERPGQQVVCFAESRQLIMIAGELAEKTGYRVGYIVGGQTARQRTAELDAFKAGRTNLMCVTTEAGGTGLDGLQVSNVQVVLQRPWSLVASIQMEDRQHRIGTTGEHVEIIDIVALDTIDTRRREVLRERAGQLSALLQDPRIVRELLGGAATDKLTKRTG